MTLREEIRVDVLSALTVFFKHNKTEKEIIDNIESLAGAIASNISMGVQHRIEEEVNKARRETFSDIFANLPKLDMRIK